MKSILYYIHDPMCSWCWGFTRTYNELIEHLEDIKVVRLLGGLASDTDTPMPNSMQQQIKSNWAKIEESIPNVKFNYDFWTKNIPYRSTYPACRAVIAARQQGDKYDALMTRKIQHAYYKEARNPSDNDTLISLAEELNLDIDKFIKSFYSEKCAETLNKEILLCRDMFVEAYPSLVIVKNGKYSNINVNYTSYLPMYHEIISIIGAKEI